jgi:hypothetical protein
MLAALIALRISQQNPSTLIGLLPSRDMVSFTKNWTGRRHRNSATSRLSGGCGIGLRTTPMRQQSQMRQIHGKRFFTMIEDKKISSTSYTAPETMVRFTLTFHCSCPAGAKALARQILVCRRRAGILHHPAQVPPVQKLSSCQVKVSKRTQMACKTGSLLKELPFHFQAMTTWEPIHWRSQNYTVLQFRLLGETGQNNDRSVETPIASLKRMNLLFIFPRLRDHVESDLLVTVIYVCFHLLKVIGRVHGIS